MNVSRETLAITLQEKLLGWLESWGLDDYDYAVDRLVEYAFLLSEYDKANVVGTRDPERIVELHVMDSLSCLLQLRLVEVSQMVDVGSGAGLPGIPLKLCLESPHLNLVESTHKKAVFLEAVIEALGIRDATVINARVEDAGRDSNYRSGQDLATVRAVAALPVLAEYCLPLVKVGGCVVAMKGRPSHEELEQGKRAAEVLNGKLENIVPVPQLPGTEAKSRCLVVFRKLKKTPKTYPRRVGMPVKSPLGQ